MAMFVVTIKGETREYALGPYRSFATASRDAQALNGAVLPLYTRPGVFQPDPERRAPSERGRP